MTRSGIGLLNEKPLHAALKEWYAQPGDQIEVEVDGYVIDIVRDDLLMEIQTGTVASLKSKLKKLVRSHKVRLIYPVAQEKWIVKLAKDGSGKESRRKSPKRGRVEDLFWEMVSIPHLMSNPNFSLEVVLIQEEEVRRHDPRRNWRRRGWGTEERRLLEVLGRKLFQQPSDWMTLVPDELETFTAGDLAEAADVRLQLAQRMVYCLRHAKAVDLVGKRGRAHLYRVN